MNIALDFDETYSLDPDFWGFFLQLCRAKNVNCYIVTLRNDTEEDRLHIESTIALPVPIIFCGFRFKSQVIEEQGIKIDIWIDDLPFAITDEAKLSNPKQNLLQLLRDNNNV